MKHYSVIPTDWDYTRENEIMEQNQKGICIPSEIPELVESCGSLYPYITTKQGARKFVKGLKDKYPFVSFSLLAGDMWGNMELVEII